MQAPNVAAAAMVDACARTRQMGADALAKAIQTANGEDPRSQGRSVWEHFGVLQEQGVKVGVDIQLPSTIKVDRAGVQAFQDACMAQQGKDQKAFMECAPKLQAVNLAFAGVQTAVLDSGMAFLLANNVSYGCRAQATTTATNAEKTALLGGGQPDNAADDVHYRQILAGAKQGDALAAGMNTLVAAYQAIGDLALSPEQVAPLMAALPEVLDMPVEVTDAELLAFHQQARADAAADPTIQQAIENLEAWSRDQNGGVTAPPKGFAGSIQAIASGLMSGNLSEAAQGIVGFLPEDSPVRAGVTCLTAILDRDFKTAFKAARTMLPKDSKLRSALDVVPL